MKSNALFSLKAFDFKTIRDYVAPNERIFVIPYNPDVYILANRLSVKKYHAYLPWEADYAKHSWHGYQRDIYMDLPRAMPPVIYYDHWIVWGVYDPQNFMRCVVKILQTDYTRLTSASYIYIRNDRYEAYKKQ